jgi:hypothetical protein
MVYDIKQTADAYRQTYNQLLGHPATKAPQEKILI